MEPSGENLATESQWTANVLDAMVQVPPAVLRDRFETFPRDAAKAAAERGGPATKFLYAGPDVRYNRRIGDYSP